MNGAFTPIMSSCSCQTRSSGSVVCSRVRRRPVAGTEEWPRLPELDIEKGDTAPVFDHGSAWSVYFADPYAPAGGHELRGRPGPAARGH